MRLLLTMFLFVAGHVIFAQNLTCKVTAASGLNVRSEPSIKGKVIGRLNANQIIEIEAKTYGELTVEGVPGFWRKTEINGKEGYVWDGYLEIIGRVTTTSSSVKNTDTNKRETSIELNLLLETYNHCGDLSHVNPSEFWYAFVPNEKNKTISVAPVEISVCLSRNRLSKSMEFDIQTNSEQRSLFLIGANQELSIPEHFISIEDELRTAGRQVMPGQRRLIGRNVHMSALGNVRSLDGDCPKIDNYRLHLFTDNKRQDVLGMLSSIGDCGVPDLYWYGDLTGDGFPDIIMVSVEENTNTFYLLKHSFDRPEAPYQVVSTFTMKDCE